MIKTVIFDIDGTMYDYERSNKLALGALKEYCVQHLDLTTTVFRQTLQQADALAVRRIGFPCAAVHNRLLRFQCMLELLGKPLFPHGLAMYHTYWDTLMEHMQPYENLKEFMELLKSRNVGLGIGTNMTAYIQYEKLKKLGVASLVDWVVTSEEAGVEKPDSGFFQLCVEKSGCGAEECLFIGDSVEGDIKGALESGLQALLYEPVENTTAEMHKGLRRVKSYSQCIEDITKFI